MIKCEPPCSPNIQYCKFGNSKSQKLAQELTNNAKIVKSLNISGKFMKISKFTVFVSLETYPQFITNKVTIKKIDYIWILVFSHHKDFINNEFFLWLLVQIHGFYGDFPACRHFYGYEHSTRCPVKEDNYILAASWENQQCGFRTGLTRIDLYSRRKELEA